MTTSEKLLLAQTVILFLTAVVIIWYTYETHSIRKETAKQHLILAQQLVLLQRKEKYEREKEVSLMQPVFRLSGGNWHAQGGYFEFKNHGEPIRNLSFESTGDIKATMRSINHLGTGEKVRIDIQQMPESGPKTFPFVLRYTDKLGNQQTQALEYDFARAQMK